MVIVRLHGAAPKVSEFSLDVAVTCIGISPAGGTIYGCVDGTVCVFSSAPTDVVVDVFGWMRGAFVGLTPTRLFDTRS